MMHLFLMNVVLLHASYDFFCKRINPENMVIVQSLQCISKISQNQLMKWNQCVCTQHVVFT